MKKVLARAAVATSIVGLTMVAVPAYAQTTAPELVEQTASDAAQQLFSLLVIIVPVIVGLLLAFWGIRTVLGKMGLRKAKI